MNGGALDAALRSLKRDRSNAWDSATMGGAPHKPLVLLALCDVAEVGHLTTPFVPFEGSVFELLGRSFQSFWGVLFESSRPGTLWMPLWHLSSDGFWKPEVRADQAELPVAPKGMGRLREHYSGARIDDELFARLLDPVARQELRALLLGNYFDELARAALLERIYVHLRSEAYAERLIGLAHGLAHGDALSRRADFEALSVQESPPVRTQGFRIAVVGAYEHRCAACGLRLQTPDGLTAVQAAHIRPWSDTHDDRINNGLALCPTCHWSFDRFLWTTKKDVRISVTATARWDRNMPGALETLDGRDLHLPSDATMRPDPESLAWHRKQAS